MCGEFMYRIAIASLWAGSILYGLYVTLFAASVYVLVKRRPNKPFLVTSVSLFVLTTALTVVYFLKTLLTPAATSASTIEGGVVVPCSFVPAGTHETAVGNLLLVIGHICTAAMFVIADGFLIIRCAVLWGTAKRVVAFPTTLLLASTACNMARIHYDSLLLSPGARTAAAATTAAQFSTAGTSLSLATNMATSFLIASRIWRMTRDIEKVLGKKAGVPYRGTIAMITESGALFTAALAAELAVSFAAVPVDVADMIVGYVMAICPTVIIVRVGMGHGFDTVQDSVHRRGASYVGGGGGGGTTTTLSAMQFRSVQESSMVSSDSDEENESEKERRDSMV